jgi:AraC-like DNA-binding protein
MSRSQIHRKLRALTNQSCEQFILSVRLQRAAELLRQKAGTVSEIAYQTGFGSPSYFASCFKKQFGCPPSKWLNG